MYNDSVLAPEQLPYPEKNRKSTDVCCTWIGAIFALVLFLLACIWFDRSSLNAAYFNGAASADGSACASGLVQFSNLNNATLRTCVSSCQSGYSANNGVCVPNDPVLSGAFYANKQITRGWDYNGFKTTLFWTSLIALSYGLLWMTLVHCAPKIAPMVAIVLGIILLFIVGLCTVLSGSGFFASNGLTKIIVSITCFLLGVVLIAMLCSYHNQIKFQGILLDYSRRFLSQNPYTFAYIPVYILLSLGLTALFIFQHCGFSSRSTSSTNFFNFANPGFWGVLNVLEFIWGLQFLRDSFNFCVSGNAVDWYWTRQTSCYSSYKRLVCRNWGSVVGGSFLNAFFEVPTLLAELVICHPNACCSKCGTCCYNGCNCFGSFFNLVRTDAYSYINLTGIPFCNAARECQKLCSQTDQFIGTHSAMKHYRFAAHVFCVVAVLLMGYLILRFRVINVGFWHLVVLLVVIYAIVTWFVEIHADAAEGIQTSFLAEHYSSEGYPYMQKCIPSYRKQLEHIRTRKIGDGHC